MEEKNTYEVLQTIFFRNYTTRFIDSENEQENFVSKSKSIIRLQWIGIVLGIVLGFVATILTGTLMQYFNIDLPIIYTPEVQKEQLGLGIPHIALIYGDGSVYDVSTQPDISPSRGKLIKLPKSESYFGYSDEHGSLYLMDGDLSKPITQYNKALFKSGHQKLEKSKNPLISDNHYFSNGIRVGDIIWTWGNKDPVDNLQMFNYGPVSCVDEDMNFDFNYLKACQDTFIWYIKKKQWRRGPKIPKYLYDPWAATSINRTAILFVGRLNNPNIPFHPIMSSIKEYTAVFDFEYKKWEEYPAVFQDFPSHLVISLSLVCEVTKLKKMVYAYIHSWEWDGDHEDCIILQSYDMNLGIHGKWETLSRKDFSPVLSIVQMISIRGILYLTHPIDDIENHEIQAEIQDEQGKPHYLVNAVAYLIYK